MSSNGGIKIKQLTFDHRPDNLKEFERAIKNGSKIYLMIMMIRIEIIQNWNSLKIKVLWKK